MVVPRENLSGPGTYEVTVNYTIELYGNSGEADAKLWLRTVRMGDTTGGTRLAELGVPIGTDEAKSVRETKTVRVEVESDDPGIVLWCRLDNEVPGTSSCAATVSVERVTDVDTPSQTPTPTPTKTPKPVPGSGEVDFHYEYSGDDNNGTEQLVVPRRTLSGPGTYEVTVDYSLVLQGHSGEADAKLWLRTARMGDTTGGTRLRRATIPAGTNEDRTVNGTVTRTVTVTSSDPGIVLWCHLDSEQPGTSSCAATVSVRKLADEDGS